MSVSSEIGGGLVFFGDSLTDDGNLYAASAGILPDDLRDALAGETGAASDGPTHAVYAAAALGDVAYQNYAVAGAEAIGTQAIGDFITEQGYGAQILLPPDDPALDWDMNLTAQLDRYLADTAGQDLSGTTAVVLVGLNDYAAIDASGTQGAREFLRLMPQVVAATIAAAERLLAAGLDAVVIEGLPDPRFLPVTAQMGARAAEVLVDLLARHNAALAAAVQDLQSQGLDIRFLDLKPVTSAIAEDPTAFGFIAPYDLTLTSGDPALDQFTPDQVAFWDAEHPSTATHAVLGAYEVFALENPVFEMTDGIDSVSYGLTADMGFALGGNDILAASGGADSMFGGTGADSVLGAMGSDLLNGGSGDDTLEGGRDGDVVAGTSGNDIALGQAGNDVLIDGLGSDLLKGAAGDDTFIFYQAELLGGLTGTDQDTVLGAGGTDTLYLVLDHDSYLALADDLQGDHPGAALDSLGIDTAGIETIVALDGRAALDGMLASAEWYADADVWGMV